MHHAIAANDTPPPAPRPEHAALAVFARYAPTPLLRRMEGVFRDLSALAGIGGGHDDYAAPLALVRAEVALRRVRDARRGAV